MVDGRLLLRAGRVLSLDADAVLDRAARAYSLMKERAGRWGDRVSDGKAGIRKCQWDGREQFRE